MQNKSSTMRIDLIPEISNTLFDKPMAKIVTTQKKIVNTVGIADGGRARSYADLFQNMYDAGIITDLHGRIRDVNPRALDAFGYTQEELCSLDIDDVVFSMTEEHLRALYGNLQMERFSMITAYCLRKDGTNFPAEIAVSRIKLSTPHMAFFIRDTTLNREKNDLLRIEHNALQNATDAIVVINLKSEIEYANPATAKLWYYPSTDDIVGRHLGELFINASDVEQIMAQFSSEHHETSGVVIAMRPDKTTFRAQLRASSNRNSDGDVVGAVISFTDLTEKDLYLTSTRMVGEIRENFNELIEYYNSLLLSLGDMRSLTNYLKDCKGKTVDDELLHKIDELDGVGEGMNSLLADAADVLEGFKSCLDTNIDIK